MPKNKKLFSKEMTKTHNVYRFFGIKIAVRDKKRPFEETIASKYIQDTLDLSDLRTSKEIILFLIPVEAKVNGGIMCIFSLCEFSREIKPDAYCLLSTYPNGKTYVINDQFHNNEKIFRFDQIVNNAKNVQKLILQVPEYYADDFYADLNEKDIKFLKSIPELQINIMNQNIELMPEPETLQDLYKLTDNITQTTGFDKYSSQEICDKWGIPTYPVPSFHNMLNPNVIKRKPFSSKEKIIVYSPDSIPEKKDIINNIKEKFPDYKVIQIQDLSYKEYLNLIGRAMFSITFGEGYDGYFIEPIMLGSLGITVYNEQFFPSSDFKKYPVVFDSYEELNNKIEDTFNYFIQNPDKYDGLSEELAQNIKKYNYHPEKTIEGLKNLYSDKPTFIPRKEVNNV